MATTADFPPLSVKYVLLGMIEESRAQRPFDLAADDPWSDVIEFFWPAESADVFAAFERCLVRLLHELESAAPIASRPRAGQGGVFRVAGLSRHIDTWYRGGEGLRYAMFPALTDARGLAARVSFLKGVLLRCRRPLSADRVYLTGNQRTWAEAANRVFVDLGFQDVTLRFMDHEGCSYVLSFPLTDWVMRLHALELPW